MGTLEFIIRVACGWFVGSLLYSFSVEVLRTVRQGYRIAAVKSHLNGEGKRPTLRAWFHAEKRDFMQFYHVKGIGPYWIKHDGKSRITARR